MMNEPISTIMTRKVVTVRPDDTLAAVRRILFTKHVHHIPVLEGRRLVGIITSFDLFKSGKSIEEMEELKVADYMTRRVATLEPTNKIGAAAEIFLENLFHGLPIVNEDKDLVGIITTHDVLKYEFNKEYPSHQLHWAVV